MLLYKKPISTFYKIDTKVKNTIDVPENEIYKYVSNQAISISLSNFSDIMKYYSQYNHKERKNSRTYHHNLEVIQHLPIDIVVEKIDDIPYVSIYTISNDVSEKYCESIKKYLSGQISDGIGENGHEITNKKGKFLFFLEYR